MYEVRQTAAFAAWLSELRDPVGRKVVEGRLRQLASGTVGDSKGLGSGLHELRIFAGPGYRLYFVRRGPMVVLLLCAGDKSTQSRDIARARRLAAEAE